MSASRARTQTTGHPNENFAPTFYLTQRLSNRDHPHGNGFDAHFKCDYMGSSEFEYGALPASLKRMRADVDRLTVHVGQVTRNDVTTPVFVVGAPDRVTVVPDALTAWMADKYPQAKERTYFPEQVDRTAQGYEARTNAWWSLSDDVVWALDADTADRLLLAVRGA